MRDQWMNHDFSQLMANQSTRLSQSANEFAMLWPIFDVRDLRKRNIRRWQSDNRQELVTNYLSSGATKFEPQCWERHVNNNQTVPIDWPHTLATIYRVRCNLFHGEKSLYSQMDQMVVESAFRTLVDFFDEAKYLDSQ